MSRRTQTTVSARAQLHMAVVDALNRVGAHGNPDDTQNYAAEVVDALILDDVPGQVGWLAYQGEIRPVVNVVCRDGDELAPVYVVYTRGEPE